MSSLFTAVQNNDVQQVRNLISRPDVNVNEFQQGQTPLFAACANNFQEIVELLLTRHDCDVNRKCFNENSEKFKKEE